MLPDTGATTTLHNTQNSPQPLPTKYAKFITWDNSDQNVGNLNDKLTFELSARTIRGRTARFFKFKTTSVVNAGNVNVLNNTPGKTDYYVNTGLSLFLAYDMIFNLKAGELGPGRRIPPPQRQGMARREPMGLISRDARQRLPSALANPTAHTGAELSETSKNNDSRVRVKGK